MTVFFRSKSFRGHSQRTHKYHILKWRTLIQKGEMNLYFFFVQSMQSRRRRRNLLVFFLFNIHITHSDIDWGSRIKTCHAIYVHNTLDIFFFKKRQEQEQKQNRNSFNLCQCVIPPFFFWKGGSFLFLRQTSKSQTTETTFAVIRTHSQLLFCWEAVKAMNGSL